MLKTFTPLLALALVACSQDGLAPADANVESATATPAVSDADKAAVASEPMSSEPMSSEPLARALLLQDDATQARYVYRHPSETLEFFGIEPGMTVVEALPGGGWYSKILLPYLGKNGKLVGADYALDMFPKFGFFSEERLEKKRTWIADWTAEANGWRNDDSAEVSAFVFGSMPEAISGQADAVLFIRALHNLSRFENDGAYLTAAIKDAYDALKPGGIVGIVQHEAPNTMSEEWASGSKGYLNKDRLIAQVEQGGFEFVGASDINANPKEIPGEEDIVWRLPPSYATSGEDPLKRAKMDAIGESNRMTLKFRKSEVSQ